MPYFQLSGNGVRLLLPQLFGAVHFHTEMLSPLLAIFSLPPVNLDGTSYPSASNSRWAVVENGVVKFKEASVSKLVGLFFHSRMIKRFRAGKDTETYAGHLRFLPFSEEK